MENPSALAIPSSTLPAHPCAPVCRSLLFRYPVDSPANRSRLLLCCLRSGWFVFVFVFLGVVLVAAGLIFQWDGGTSALGCCLLRGDDGVGEADISSALPFFPPSFPLPLRLLLLLSIHGFQPMECRMGWGILLGWAGLGWLFWARSRLRRCRRFLLRDCGGCGHRGSSLYSRLAFLYP